MEIDKTPGSSLGITLGTGQYKGSPVICIESIRPASIADRYMVFLLGTLNSKDKVISDPRKFLDSLVLMETILWK